MSFFRSGTKSAVASFAAALFASALPQTAHAQSGSDVTQPQQLDASAASARWQANDDDFLFLKLTIKRYKMNLDVRGYRTDRGVCLDLADVIQSLDLPIRIDKKSRRATGWIFAENQSFTLDRDSNTVQTVNNNGSGRAPVANDIYDTPEGWCVDTKALSRWMGIEFNPDLYNSTIRLESDEDLPFMQALERKSRAARLRSKRKSFDLSKFPTADMEYKPWRTPSIDVVARAGLQSGASSLGRNDQTRVELLAAGEALGASYTARLTTDDNLAPQALRIRAYRNDPQGGLLGPLDATQVAVGDVETLAGRLTGQTAIGRGAFVSNRPLGRAQRFAATTLRGALPTGWDAELYRNGQLIAFQDDRGDGRYEFLEIDLFFGRNDLEVVLYGPQGQIRREKSSVPVGLNQIEPGQTYYWAGVVQNDRDLIDVLRNPEPEANQWRWGVGVERGLDKRTTAALGVQSVFFMGARRMYAEGAVSRTLGSLQLELAGAHEFGAGSVAELNTLGRIGRFNFGANALVSFGNFASEFANGEIDYRAGFNFDTSLKLGKRTVPIQAGVNHQKLRNGTAINQAFISTSVTAGRVNLSAQFSHEEQIAPRNAEGLPGGDGGPNEQLTRLNLIGNTRIRALRLRGNANFVLAGPDPGLEAATVRADYDLNDVSELQAELDYRAQLDVFRLTAGYTRRFDALSLRGNAFATTSGGVGASVELAFSFGPDPRNGGLRVTQSKLARSGQALVTVFRDDDGNGRRDPGEEYLADVGVEAGLNARGAVTDENGRAIVDELRPFNPVLVGIDEASLEDPFLAPSSKGIVLTPRPGVMAELELAISPTGEVEGLLISPSGVAQPGARLELVDSEGGVIAETVSEFDGFFLFQRVPYGAYQVRLAQGPADKLNVEQEIAPPAGKSAIVINNDSDLVRMGTIKLRSREGVAGEQSAPIAANDAPPITARRGDNTARAPPLP
ncbi:MAG: carboxypeptidase-like regulatory domain-containing protein [Pseudomonadota bacterium]